MGDYATLTNSWDGWNYYSDGTVISPDGTYYSGGEAIWSPASAGAADASGMIGGSILGFNLGSTLDYILRKQADTSATKTLMQQNQQGLRYLEGRPGVYGVGTTGKNSLLPLLLLGGLLFVVAKA